MKASIERPEVIRVAKPELRVVVAPTGVKELEILFVCWLFQMLEPKNSNKDNYMMDSDK